MKVIISLILLLSTPVLADVYKTVTPDGEVIYSDVRTQGSEQINVPKPQTYTPPPTPQPLLPVNLAAEAEIYESFVIDSPLNEDTIRDNLGNVEVILTLEPALVAKDGHRIEYFLDGKLYGRRTVDTERTFTALDRGEHKLSAVVVDNKGVTLIRAEPVTVHLQKHSRLNPNSPLNPKNKPKPTPPIAPSASAR